MSDCSLLSYLDILALDGQASILKPQHVLALQGHTRIILSLFTLKASSGLLYKSKLAAAVQPDMYKKIKPYCAGKDIELKNPITIFHQNWSMWPQ